MLAVSRISYVVFGDIPVEYVEAFLHSERYQHYNELSSGPDGDGG